MVRNCCQHNWLNKQRTQKWKNICFMASVGRFSGSSCISTGSWWLITENKSWCFLDLSSRWLANIARFSASNQNLSGNHSLSVTSNRMRRAINNVGMSHLYQTTSQGLFVYFCGNLEFEEPIRTVNETLTPLCLTALRQGEAAQANPIFLPHRFPILLIFVRKYNPWEITPLPEGSYLPSWHGTRG